MIFRIGHGFDIHPFEEGKPLMLGGVHIPYSQGMKGHSDGDVILHAVCDAMLGALALGDIGQHFSDQDAQYKNVDSRLLLKKVMSLVAEKGFMVGNLDVTVLAEKPKLAPYVLEMRKVIAEDIQVNETQVSVKATTMEKMDAVGEGRAISAHAVVLLQNAEAS
jgi:2-C-methyl-D-erythritol 2,4-cyclodiphosphate synthase